MVWFGALATNHAEGAEVVSPHERLLARIAEWAVDEEDIGLSWEVNTISVNTLVRAATKQTYGSYAGALEGAVNLWKSILELGFATTEEGEQEIGVLSRYPDNVWRGRVKMVLRQAG
jgi:hypothetical protein